MSAHCEACSTTEDLVCCGLEDQPMLWFCRPDYVEHVLAAHPNTNEAANLRETTTKMTHTSAEDPASMKPLIWFLVQRIAETGTVRFIRRHENASANCGTLSMTNSEWDLLRSALAHAPRLFQIEDKAKQETEGPKP